MKFHIWLFDTRPGKGIQGSLWSLIFVQLIVIGAPKGKNFKRACL